MSLNPLTVKKFLLTTGLLIILGHGLWQLPALQDYLYPVDRVKLFLTQASKECSIMKEDLITLNARLDYLNWFQTHDGPNQKISAKWWRDFPFSESIRPLAPKFFWHTNIRLAHKNRLKVERKLLYLKVLLKNMDENSLHPAHSSPAIPAKTADISNSRKKIKQFHDQSIHYDAKLMELSKQLAWLENNGYKE